ncbi:hypothetical protein AXX17_AT1G67510 [Arabidopsis thaliana]|uniref:Serine carboxypeptidase-like 7 n=1 Tax=Arabidopsis thaliana TaxID=3702 RepID=A0A178W8Q1_ARATH|nr:hypothetical protein AXX17_AT1G67510 [Arabidopsis thaliana]
MANKYFSSVLKSLLLLLHLVFLSKQHVDSASIVKFLPGFEGPLPFELETGYIGVGEEEEVQLFYYFIKSERNPKEDPLILWLTGGPGCSSISGLLFENGPLTMKLDVYNGTLPSLVSTTYSWTKTSSMIFLDQPVGTGFSYSRTQQFNKPSDSGEAKRIHEFLQKWLGKHQEFSSNPFYVAGDSYSGLVVPATVQEISKGNYECCNPPINLQGYVLGNPLTDYAIDSNSRIPFAHGMALISDELYESLKKSCKGEYTNVHPRNTQCLKFVEEFNKCTNRILQQRLLDPLCETETPDCYIYRYLLTTYWANDATVREALQINKESIGEWVRCYRTIPYDNDIIGSMPYHVNNSISGYRSLIYSGDHDLEVPYLGTQAWIRSLNYSIIDDWRPWMIKNQIAGYSLLLLLHLVFLIQQHVDSASIVKFLPGFEGSLPFELETGYIGVGEEEEVQLFYYFIKSERNPKEDPLLLWLSGGPGCSSISGLLFENGPLAMKLDVYNGTLPSLVPTTYSWTKTSSMIFLDQPVGTGFSYSRTQQYNKPSDSGEAKRIHEFLQKWLSKHQEFSSNPFYVAGDSYSGMVVPATVQEISKGNYQCCSPPINLQGYVLGNPITEHAIDYNYRIPFAHGMALISDELYESLKRVCKGEYVDPRDTECLKLVEEFSKESIGEWVRCYFGIPYTHDIKSSVPYHMNNSINGYRSLIYSGDHDLNVPFLATQAWVRSLNYSIIDNWRPWMIKDQIGGNYVFSVLRSLLLLIHTVFLGQHHVSSATIIKSLPGFEGPLPFELETGYIGVGEEEEVQLFYYFIKSERNPKEDPLLLWLSGGPGCSSISGLLFENGPLAMKLDVYNGTLPSLVSTTYSWTKASSMIFLDQPVGAGFSYSRTQLLNKPSDSGEAKRIHEFLQKWLGKHQEFSSNPFYVGGDSYSGMVVPATVQEISKGNYECCNPPINLQGYVLGNPLTDFVYDYNSRIPFAHGMALISDELFESLKKTCKGDYRNVHPRNTECLKFIEEFNKCTNSICQRRIIDPFCETETPNCYIYRFLLAAYWANDETVRKALQIKKETIGEWVRCHYGIPYNYDIKSSIPYHMNNSINGYRSLIYSGDHDFEVPFLGTQAWIRSLNYSVIDDWRPWMIKDQIAGYTRTYANKMTFATIRGGGHTAEFKPEETSIMFQRWINGQPL